MKKDSAEKALLPSGFVDLLFPEAEREARAISILMKEFAGFGYQRVKPPLAEFEESLLADGPGAARGPEIFRFVDPTSHRMMGLRADITPQIARLASSRLCDEPRPLRLTYANDVIRTKGNQQRTERQFCQVGCEIIGDDDLDADIESCLISLVGLSKLGLEDIVLDLSYPKFIDGVFEAFDCGAEDKDVAMLALDRKDVSAFENKDDPLNTTLQTLVECHGEGKQVLKKISALNLPPSLAEKHSILKKAYEALSKALNDLKLNNVTITIDLCETKGFQYHTGLAFTLFTSKITGELGRGGRYTIQNHDGGETACGFTLYMDTIRKAMGEDETKMIKEVSKNEGWDTIMKHRKDGYTVIRKG